MERGRLPIYFLTALLAGAVVAILLLAPRPAEPSGDVAAPSPTPIASSTADVAPLVEPTTLYDARLDVASSGASDEGRHVFRIRPGDRDLAVVIDAPAGSEPSYAVSVQNPQGLTMERCGDAECAWTFARPQEGLWRLVVPAQRTQPVDIDVTVVRTSPLPGEEDVYDEERELPQTTTGASWEDAFIVLPGQTTLEFEVGASGATVACGATSSVAVLRPDGATAAVFTDTYVQRNAEPGRWLLQYDVGPCQSAFGRVRAIAP